MRKSPRWGWGQLIRAPGKGPFNEDWKIIRLNLNLFEYKSLPTAGKGSSSPASFVQEGSKRNCKTARSAVSGLGLGSEKEIAMRELSIWDTQNNSKGQITNSRQSVDKPPPLQHLRRVSAQFPLPLAGRSAGEAPSHAGRGERGQLPLEQPRAGSPRPVGYRRRAPLRVSGAGWAGRPRAFSAPLAWERRPVAVEASRAARLAREPWARGA